MFSFFKRQVHDSIEIQLKDLQREPIGPFAMAGLDCDVLPNASGPFGHNCNNPIPVNGLMGTYKYLNKLVSPSRGAYYFHRLGSLSSEAASNPVDAFELVDMHGAHWDILFLDMYHPRRSNKQPSGYEFMKYDNEFGDVVQSFGVDVYCENFPYDLPDSIRRRNNWPVFADMVRDRISQGGFDRPEVHALKVSAVKLKLTAVRT